MLIANLERWTLQDAKNRFSELVRLVLANGPRVVTRDGMMQWSCWRPMSTSA